MRSFKEREREKGRKDGREGDNLPHKRHNAVPVELRGSQAVSGGMSKPHVFYLTPRRTTAATQKCWFPLAA